MHLEPDAVTNRMSESVAQRRGLQRLSRRPVHIRGRPLRPDCGQGGFLSLEHPRVNLSLQGTGRPQDDRARNIGAISVDGGAEVEQKQVALPEASLRGARMRKSRSLPTRDDRLERLSCRALERQAVVELGRQLELRHALLDHGQRLLQRPFGGLNSLVDGRELRSVLDSSQPLHRLREIVPHDARATLTEFATVAHAHVAGLEANLADLRAVLETLRQHR